MKMRLAILRASAVLLALAPAPALADAITLGAANVGQSFTLAYNGFDGSGGIAGLTGAATFTLTGVTANSFIFNYSVANTSSSPIDTSRISGFGFNTNPDISGASSTGTFDIAGVSSNAPNIGTVDVCFRGGGGGSQCAGGGGGGVALGDTGAGLLTLSFASALSVLSLSDFFVRYQSITGGGAPSSAVGTGTISSSGGGSSGGTPVPEPGMFGLLAIVGGAGLYFSRRRRRSPALAAA